MTDQPALTRRAALATGAATLLAAASPTQTLPSLRGPTQPFPPYWSDIVGSGHAVLGLRADWQADLARLHQSCGFRAVRFHGLLDDDLGLCRSIGPDGPVLHFLGIDRLIDTMLAMGVRPFVELSFMPLPLASSENSIFWYQANTSPPNSAENWARLIAGLARHFLDRYGAREVLGWRFECWNEPNLNFWAADQAAYFRLYATTARALKSVHPGLTVGGPATAQMGWIPEFLHFCATESVPVDFVSSHIYADDPQANVFGYAANLPPARVMPAAMRRAQAAIAASAFPHLPLLITEWTSQNPAFIAQMVKDCAGLCAAMSYWTFDNTFEEHGPELIYQNGNYGLLNPGGVPRPSYHAFHLLHRLGPVCYAMPDSAPILATRRPDGTAAMLVWNLPPDQSQSGLTGNPMHTPTGEILPPGPTRSFTVPTGTATTARVTRVDPATDSAAALYQRLGSPESPTLAQFAALRAAATLPHQTVRPNAGRLTLNLPANALALVELPPPRPS